MNGTKTLTITINHALETTNRQEIMKKYLRVCSIWLVKSNSFELDDFNLAEFRRGITMHKSQPIKSSIKSTMIAPCGMNCHLCLGYIREKNRCPGCRKIDNQDSQKSKYRNRCRIKNCEQIAKGKIKYCSDSCRSYPCARLRQLDKRYRTKYGMSMIANLEKIKESGIRSFVRDEKEKWRCTECGRTICVHRTSCIYCGKNRY